MQPIKTTNAMNPAPAKGIESFPTPVIDDVVISEIVNSWKGDYQPLEYGTLWKDVSHAPNQGSFPEHKLVYQQPTSEDGQWVKRIWVNDRVNQDSYNYAIKYSAGSQDHPIYIRTYIVPRETYAPLPDGTPDPLFPGALLVDEEAVRNEGELDSKYITVTRVYETLPGPEVPTKRYNERGDLETVIVQTVPPNTPPTADGLLVTQSQVEQVETGKGVKTTATVQDHALLQIKEKKEGLLGETITTDDIVDHSTNPDQLSQTIVASVVEQYTATKARKRTTTASGPNSLSQKSKDGKLLGDITSTESIVDPNTNPDAVSQSVLSSEVRQVDSGKAIKRNVVLNSTPTLSGNQSEQGLLGNKSTIERIVSAGATADPLSLSIISSTVEPIDSARSRKITVTSSGPTSLSGRQKKEGLLGETTVAESIVPEYAQPDALSQTVVSSVVEPIDSSKSKKTTVTASGPTTLTGNQTKEGLLGEAIINQSIVPAGSPADAPSLTVISSVIEPIDSAKSKKTTIESSGPLSLQGAQKKDGLRGETEVIETIVPNGTEADEVGVNIVSSTVEPIDSAKSKKTTVNATGGLSFEYSSLVSSPIGDVVADVVKSVTEQKTSSNSLFTLKNEITPINSNASELEQVTVSSWPIVKGAELDQEHSILIPYSETIVDPNSISSFINSSSLEFSPIDEYKSKMRNYSSYETFNSYSRVSQKVIDIKLPDTLEDVVAYFGLDNGNGEGSSEASGAGDSYNYSVSGSRTSSSSATGDIYFKVKKGFSGPVSGKLVEFFEPQRTTYVNVLYRVNEILEIESEEEKVKEYPTIRLTTENIVIIGGSKSKSVSTSESASVSLNGSSNALSENTSYNVAVSANSIVIPETLHGDIAITKQTIGSLGQIDVTYDVVPPVIKATNPAEFPTGKYLFSTEVRPYRFGFFKYSCLVIDIKEDMVN